MKTAQMVHLDEHGVIRDMFDKGKSHYFPQFPGMSLKEENGVTHKSTHNLRQILDRYNSVERIEVGPDGNVFIKFFGGVDYLATGFAVGYRGEGPNGLALFMSKAFGSLRSDWLDYINKVSNDFQGILFESANPDAFPPIKGTTPDDHPNQLNL